MTKQNNWRQEALDLSASSKEQAIKGILPTVACIASAYNGLQILASGPDHAYATSQINHGLFSFMENMLSMNVDRPMVRVATTFTSLFAIGLFALNAMDKFTAAKHDKQACKALLKEKRHPFQG